MAENGVPMKRSSPSRDGQRAIGMHCGLRRGWSLSRRWLVAAATHAGTLARNGGVGLPFVRRVLEPWHSPRSVKSSVSLPDPPPIVSMEEPSELPSRATRSLGGDFFQEELRPTLHEGREGHLHRKHSSHHLKAAAEVSNVLQCKCSVIDGLTDVIEGVVLRLQVSVVLGNHRVTLHSVTEFDADVDHVPDCPRERAGASATRHTPCDVVMFDELLDVVIPTPPHRTEYDVWHNSITSSRTINLGNPHRHVIPQHYSAA